METNSNSIRYNQVYYVESYGNMVNPVAITPEINNSIIQWQDTSKGKIVKSKNIGPENFNDHKLPDVINIESVDGTHYKLIKLTIDVYNDKVKSRVMGPPKFKSTEEVQNFYLNTDFGP